MDPVEPQSASDYDDRTTDIPGFCHYLDYH